MLSEVCAGDNCCGVRGKVAALGDELALSALESVLGGAR